MLRYVCVGTRCHSQPFIIPFIHFVLHFSFFFLPTFSTNTHTVTRPAVQIAGEDLPDMIAVEAVREVAPIATTAECRLFLQRIRDVVSYEKTAHLFSLQA